MLWTHHAWHPVGWFHTPDAQQWGGHGGGMQRCPGCCHAGPNRWGHPRRSNWGHWNRWSHFRHALAWWDGRGRWWCCWNCGLRGNKNQCCKNGCFKGNFIQNSGKISWKFMDFPESYFSQLPWSLGFSFKQAKPCSILGTCQCSRGVLCDRTGSCIDPGCEQVLGWKEGELKQ